jgi:hypothetical protein
MPRSAQSRESAIVAYFATADLAIAEVVMKLAKDALGARMAKSKAARELALKAQKAAEKVKAAKVTAPAAAPKKAKKKPGPKPRVRPAPASIDPNAGDVDTE